MKFCVASICQPGQSSVVLSPNETLLFVAKLILEFAISNENLELLSLFLYRQMPEYCCFLSW